MCIAAGALPSLLATWNDTRPVEVYVAMNNGNEPVPSAMPCTRATTHAQVTLLLLFIVTAHNGVRCAPTSKEESHEEAFERVYRLRAWGGDGINGSLSGQGSFAIRENALRERRNIHS